MCNGHVQKVMRLLPLAEWFLDGLTQMLIPLSILQKRVLEGTCIFLKRKCGEDCVFSPYFYSEDMGATQFSEVHKIFGASNFSKLLQKVSLDKWVRPWLPYNLRERLEWTTIFMAVWKILLLSGMRFLNYQFPTSFMHWFSCVIFEYFCRQRCTSHVWNYFLQIAELNGEITAGYPEPFACANIDGIAPS